MSNRFDIRTRREEYGLPASIDGIIDLIRKILTPGAVQKLVLELGRPIIVHRAVKEEGELIEEEIDFDSVLRNVQMVEYGETKDPFHALFEVCQMLRAEKLLPVYLVTSQHKKILPKWLGVEIRQMLLQEESIMGIPVRRLKSLPGETLVVCGSPYSDAEAADITVAVKLTMEVKDETVEQDAGRGGGHSEEDDSGDGIVGNPPDGGGRGPRDQEGDVGGRANS